MSDKPILMKPFEIRALLAGRKTQWRRVITGAPKEATSAGTIFSTETGHSNVWTWLSGVPEDFETWDMLNDFRLPYKIDDRLYVREAWRTADVLNDVAPRDIKGTEDSVIDYTPICYEADGATDSYNPHHDPAFGRLRQGMHMPRWASRITLTVTDVRVQRLQEISQNDALAEGISIDKTLPEHVHRCWLDLGNNSAGADWLTGWDARDVYSQLWHVINGPGSWEANPWVAAYTFSVEKKNIDAV